MTQTEDDREAAFSRIVELLLAGGYFRARIQGLSRFDRAIGGLTWAVTSAAMDVDVDLFFQENPTIGQKIALADKIVLALRKMSCPYPISAPQIRGENWPDLFPVVQWLIAKVIETRQDLADTLRNLAHLRFAKSEVAAAQHDSPAASLPEPTAEQQEVDRFRHPLTRPDREFQQRRPSAVAYSTTLRQRYHPRRAYRRNTADNTDARKHLLTAINSQDEDDAVQATLLEYGDLSGMVVRALRIGQQQRRRQSKAIAANASRLASVLGGGADASSSASSSGASGDDDDDAAEEARRRQAEEARMQQILQGMGKAKLNSRVVGAHSIFSLDEVISLVKEDQEHLEALPEAELTPEDLQEREHKRALQKRQEQLEELEAKRAAVEARHGLMKQKFEELAEQYTAQQQTNQQIEAQLQKLTALETPENLETLKHLRKLVSIFEALKQQEQEFNSSIEAERAKWQKLLADAKSLDPDDVLSPEDREIKTRYEKLKETLQNLKKRDSKIKRLIALLKRKIDAIPSRTELQQYQQQFLELYDLVARRFIETRTYFATYNTLDTQLEYLSKEVKILESIEQQYKTAVRSKAGREAFQTQIAALLTSVDQSLTQTTQQHDQLKERFDGLNEKYLDLANRERQYFKAVKQLQTEAELQSRKAAAASSSTDDSEAV